MKIVKIGDKTVERVFESSNGVFVFQTKTFWALSNQWRQSNYQINVSEEEKNM